MHKPITPLILALVVVLAGCASAPRSDSTTAEQSTTTDAVARIADPVSIPKASSRNVVLTMTGPNNVVESKDWPEFKREWRETFADYAKQEGITYTFVDTPPAPGKEDGTLLLVNVSDYRIVGVGMRIMFGIMTGNAFIEAQIAYTNLRDGTTFGKQDYKTTSSASGGVFAKVTPQQVDQIAANVFMDLKAAK